MSSGEIERDRALVIKAQQTPEAFGPIFDLYYSKILSYVLKRVGEAELAQDITAETFVKAFKGIKKFNWRGVPFSAWLYRIAGNEVKMWYRHPKYTTSLDVLAEAGFDIASELTEERELLQELLERDQEFKKVMSTLRSLPTRQQEAIVLRYIEEKEIDEIASILRVRPASVRSLLSRGLHALEHMLKPQLQQKGEERITTSEARSVLSALK